MKIIRTLLAALALTLPAVVLADIGGPAGRFAPMSSILTPGSTVYFSSGTIRSFNASTLTVTGLTSGQCVQTTTGGRLTTTGAACGSGGGGGSGLTYSSFTATSPITYNNGTGAFALNSISLTADVSGRLPAANMVSTAAFTTSTQTFSASQTWSSPTVSTFTYGIVVGSFTVTGATGGKIKLTEGTVPTGEASKDILWADSIYHWPSFNPNNTSAYRVAGASATVVAGDCAYFSGSGSLLDLGAPCLTAAGAATTNGSITSAAQYSLGYYSALGSAKVLSGSPLFYFNGTTFTDNAAAAFTSTHTVSNITTTQVTNISTFSLTNAYVDFAQSTMNVTYILLSNSAGSSGQVLTSAGSNTAPTWTTPTSGGGGGSGTTNAAAQNSLPYYSVSGSSNVLSGSTAIFASASSMTVTGAAGFGVTYGATVGSMTVSNLTSGQCVQAGTGGLLTVTGSACGAGGGTTYSVEPATVSFNLAKGVTMSSAVIISNPASTITSTTTLTSTMSVVLAAPAAGTTKITLTLPSAATYPGLSMMIYKVDSSTIQVVVKAASGEVIESTGSIFLNAKSQRASLYSAGSNGWVGGLGGIQYTPGLIETQSMDNASYPVVASSQAYACPIWVPAPVMVTGWRVDKAGGSGTLSFGIFDMNNAFVVGLSTQATQSGAANYLLATPFNLAAGWYRQIIMASNTGITLSGSNSVNDMTSRCGPVASPANMDVSTVGTFSFAGSRNTASPWVGILVNGGFTAN